MGVEMPPSSHIRLTSHPVEGAYGALPIRWGAATPHERGFAVVDVAPGSPAAASGLAAGDVIVAMDGHPANAISLWDARTALRVPPPGTRVQLEIVRGNETRSVEVVLRDLVGRAPAVKILQD